MEPETIYENRVIRLSLTSYFFWSFQNNLYLQCFHFCKREKYQTTFTIQLNRVNKWKSENHLSSEIHSQLLPHIYSFSTRSNYSPCTNLTNTSRVPGDLAGLVWLRLQHERSMSHSKSDNWVVVSFKLKERNNMEWRRKKKTFAMAWDFGRERRKTNRVSGTSNAH